MTVAVPATDLSLDELVREIERAEAADVKHLKARRAQLEAELHERSLEEAAAKQTAAQELKRAHAALEPLYEPLLDAIERYAEAAEAVSTARSKYTLALHRARALEVAPIPPPVPKLALRASRDRALLKTLHTFRTFDNSDF